MIFAEYLMYKHIAIGDLVVVRCVVPIKKGVRLFNVGCSDLFRDGAWSRGERLPFPLQDRYRGAALEN